MKKKYVNPITELYSAESLEIMGPSHHSNTYSLTSGAEWGDSGEYAPEDWIIEGQTGTATGGYTVNPIEETDDDIISRGKAWGDLWGDFGF